MGILIESWHGEPIHQASQGSHTSQDKLDQPEYQEVSTEKQREEISGKLSAASTWLEDEGFEASTAVRTLHPST